MYIYNPFSHSDGTTDVTRTVHFGTPTQHEKVNANTEDAVMLILNLKIIVFRRTNFQGMFGSLLSPLFNSLMF